MAIDEVENMKDYKFGIFYFNPQDPLYFVRKRNGTGWTLNFGNKGIYILIILLLMIVIFSAT
jgi:uncharacterized membrane protein